MLFLVYSPLGSSSIEHSLGMADYSYYFVMKRFLPLLQEFGEVLTLEHPPSDKDIERYQASANCIYFSFTPPNKVAKISACPVVPVFAWEYSTIPDEEFTCPADNWVLGLQVAKNAITHSRYALEVVRSQLGDHYPIESIPAPIWDSCQHIFDARMKSRPRGLDGLSLDCTIIDSDDYLISNTSIRPRQQISGGSKKLLNERWDGQPPIFDFSSTEHDSTLIGFNDPESWGVWSRSGYPWMLVGCAIEGEIELRITARGYLQNIGKRLRLEMGGAKADLLLSEELQTHVFFMNVGHPTDVLAFVGVVERAVGATDPRDIGFGLAYISISRPGTDREVADNQLIDLSSDSLVYTGLYDCEEQGGRWTSSADVSVQLSTAVAGDFCLTIEVFHIMHNHGRQIDIYLGERRESVILENGRTVYEMDFFGVSDTDYICIRGLGVGPSDNPDDHRMLGLGIAGMSLQRKEVPDTNSRLGAVLETVRELGRRFRPFGNICTPESILYTAIFNPKDGRKNWEDIITAFVYAFRDDAYATLLIKITYHELAELYEDIFTYLVELHPFNCRLIFIHGFLSDNQYEQLLLHSHFVVNASRGEGQCLPLMEFMSAGVPAVAPRNSAMSEYINSSNAFIVASSPELTFWPQDPRQVFRTLWQKVDWESLVTAFSASAKLYRSSHRSYREMAKAAVESQRQYCSMAISRTRFENFLGDLKKRVGE